MLLKLPIRALHYVAEQLRETLPDDEATAGAFLSGMCYAFVLFWTFLILTTWLWLASTGR